MFAWVDILWMLFGFGAGGALVWFYKSNLQAGVVAVNAGVVTAKADVAAVSSATTTVLNDIKAKL